MAIQVDTLKELFYIFPDSILFGSFLIALTTLSFQHGVLFLTFLESFVLLSGIQNVFSFIFGKVSEADGCRSKFHTLMFGDLLGSTSANSPSYAIYVVGVACSYLLSSFYEISDELDVLDKSFKEQYNIAFFVLVSIPFIYATLRIVFGCESSMNALITVFISMFIGLLLHFQNVSLFGRNVSNFLGIPLLRNKSANNEPIYICSK